MSSFDLNTRTDIPQWIGKIVKTWDLKTKAMNGKYGLVIGFNDEKLRFVINFDGEVKLIKPANLFFPCVSKTPREYELREFMDKFAQEKKLNDKKSNYKEAQEKFQPYPNLTYTEVFMRLSWCVRQSNGGSLENPKAYEVVLQILNHIIENTEFPGLKVWAKYQLAMTSIILDAWNGFETNFDRVELILKSLKNHYGYFNLLFQFLCRHNSDQEIYKYLKKFYFEGKYLVENDMCGKNHKITFFLASAELFFDANFGAIMYPEIQYIYELGSNFHDNVLREQLAHLDAELAFARLSFLLGHHEASLGSIMKYEQKICGIAGKHVPGMTHVYGLKAECYIALGNKLLANKCLKKLNKFNKTGKLSEFIGELEEKISLMEDKIAEQKLKRVPQKCSFFKCDNMETHLGEFQCCERCRLAIYCSRKCQKRHWRNGHKKACGKY